MKDLELKEKEINEILEVVFTKHSKEEYLIFNNLKPLFKLFRLTSKNLSNSYQKYKNIDIDWHRVEQADFNKKITIINDFYKYLNINYDINKQIEENRFLVKKHNLQEATKNQNLLHKGRYERNEKNDDAYIKISDNNLITDSIIWTHELSHLRNDTSNPEPLPRKLLTESLAYANEFIYIDYLKKIGYKYESISYKTTEIKSLFNFTHSAYFIMIFLILYDKYHLINKENYKDMYGFANDYYESDINDFLNITSKRSMLQIILYSIAAPLSIYMYTEYKNNNKFIEKIEELNEAIKTKSIKECLNIIGFSTTDREGFFNKSNEDKIINAINVMTKELEQELTELNKSNKKN